MRKIMLIMSVFLVAACISEVKPVLRPAEVDIPNRIADQLKWLDQDLEAKSINTQDAILLKRKIKVIQEKYDRLQSAGALTAKDSAEISKMLDKTSELIFLFAKSKGGPVSH